MLSLRAVGIELRRSGDRSTEDPGLFFDNENFLAVCRIRTQEARHRRLLLYSRAWVHFLMMRNCNIFWYMNNICFGTLPAGSLGSIVAAMISVLGSIVIPTHMRTRSERVGGANAPRS
jgi:hypothetical protein